MHDSSKISDTPLLQPTYTELQPIYTKTDEQSYSERMKKIKELETLLYKHRSYLGHNPQTTLRGTIAYSSSREDDSLIDEKLEWLRAIDRR